MNEEGAREYRPYFNVYCKNGAGTTRHSKWWISAKRQDYGLSLFLDRYEDFPLLRQVTTIVCDKTCYDQDALAHRIAKMFPSLVQFHYSDAPMPLRFLREICGTLGERLVSLALDKCQLKELPRSLALLRLLQNLRARNNDIHWVSCRLYSHLTALCELDLRDNARIPPNLRNSPYARFTLYQLGAMDRKARATQLCWMGVLRKRRGMSRDLVALLGRALWSLRGELEHKV